MTISLKRGNMEKKIAGLVLTGFVFALVAYSSSKLRSQNNVVVEVVEVSEMGLQSADIKSDKLNKLIKEYELVVPEETPWETCQQ